MKILGRSSIDIHVSCSGALHATEALLIPRRSWDFRAAVSNTTASFAFLMSLAGMITVALFLASSLAV